MLAPVVVAFSGGADSAFLAAVAHRTLGADAARRSPRCRRRWPATRRPTAGRSPASGACSWRPVDTDEMARAAYRVNDIDRCYHCKAS